jgi:hypothetical protein
MKNNQNGITGPSSPKFEMYLSTNEKITSERYLPLSDLRHYSINGWRSKSKAVSGKIVLLARYFDWPEENPKSVKIYGSTSSSCRFLTYRYNRPCDNDDRASLFNILRWHFKGWLGLVTDLFIPHFGVHSVQF